MNQPVHNQENSLPSQQPILQQHVENATLGGGMTAAIGDDNQDLRNWHRRSLNVSTCVFARLTQLVQGDWRSQCPLGNRYLVVLL